MTTFPDPQPQSRRALRQEQRDERPLSEDVVDAPSRVSGRPTGRRARAVASNEQDPGEQGTGEQSTADQNTGEQSTADQNTGEQSTADQTTADQHVPVGEPIYVAEPAPLVAPVELQPEEHTMTRREWRMWRARQEAEALAAEGAAATEAPAAEAQDTEAPATEVPATAETSASPEPAAAASTEPAPATRGPVAYRQSAPRSASLPTQEPAIPVRLVPEDATDEQPAAVVPAARQPAGPALIPTLVEPSATPAAPISDAIAEFEALTRSPRSDGQPSPVPADVAPTPAARRPFSLSGDAQPAKSVPVVFTPPALPDATVEPALTATGSVYVPPVGHWSRQAALDDENQPVNENTLSRDVGGGNLATTTNALVLPMIPQRDEFSAILGATGEIMVTGTINLPGSLSTTGRDSRHYDDPEVDRLIDAYDTEVANTDSAPVRAITAVSSHTATRGGIDTNHRNSNRMLTVLLVTASVLAVGVFGLLIAGFVFNVF